LIDSENQLIVADAGPLIAFARLDLLALLPEMFGTLLVPEVVLNECLHIPTRQDAKVILQARDTGLLEIRRDQLAAVGGNPPALGAGELVAIRLAQSLNCLVLMDDKLARRVAASVGLRVIGTAGVLVKAKQQAKISAVVPLLHILQTSGYHLAADILQLAGEQK